MRIMSRLQNKILIAMVVFVLASAGIAALVVARSCFAAIPPIATFAPWPDLGNRPELVGIATFEKAAHRRQVARS